MRVSTGYSLGQIRLHWIVAGLIVLQFVLHDGISAAWSNVAKGIEPAFSPLVAQHVLGGFAILALVLWRLALRARNGAPLPPEAEHPALRRAARLTHGSLYLLMLALPLSGAVAWFGGIGAAAEAHEVMKALLMLLVGLHVAAALFHQFVLKTNLIARMVRPAG